MSHLPEIFENSAINFWAQHFSRSPEQLNQLHESDAEIIQIPGNPAHCLAATTDTIAEEIALGFYRDPYTMGWVTIMASLSDLAAVGADPLGMLIAVSLPKGCDQGFVDRIACGMEDACRRAGTFIIGGDTNESPTTSLTGCALGFVPRANLLSRRGCKPGDSVFMTGGAGIGNALGLVRLAGYPDAYFPEELYRPVAALRQGRLVREFATCCMDTSDGVLSTLDQMMRVNGLGFDVECDWGRLLQPEVLELCRKTGTPEWLMLGGPHGEFELIFTVSEHCVKTLQREFDSRQFPLIHLGTVVESLGLTLAMPSGRRILADMAPLRNLFQTVNGNLQKYLLELRATGVRWGVE